MKKWIVYTVLGVAMFVILYLMKQTFYEVQQSVRMTSNFLLPSLKMQLLAFLFGMSVEWNRIYRMIHGQIRRSWTIIPLLGLSVLVLIPSPLWLEWGASSLIVIEWLIIPEIGLLITGVVGNRLLRAVVD